MVFPQVLHLIDQIIFILVSKGLLQVIISFKTKVSFRIYPLLTSLFAIPGRYLHVFHTESIEAPVSVKVFLGKACNSFNFASLWFLYQEKKRYCIGSVDENNKIISK